MASRILCVNCGLCINRMARHLVLDQDVRVISFIAERKSPEIITECDYVCQACLDTVMRRVNQIIHGEISSSDNQQAGSSRSVSSQPPTVGHSKVCIMCGRSILRKQSHPIIRNNPNELQQMIAAFIMNSVTLQVTISDRVCHNCWLKARRHVVRSQHVEPHLVQLPEETVVSSETNNAVEEHHLDANTPQQPLEELEDEIEEPRSDDVEVAVLSAMGSSSSLSEWFPDAPIANVQQAENTISLENYRRASSTAAHCVFLFCPNRDLHRISDDLRIKIIDDHHFYVPVHARVCSEHLLSNTWDTLYNSGTAEFTVAQIEHMFSFINSNININIDFNNPLTIDDHLFQYWLGLTKENFTILLNEVPEIQNLHRGVTGLVGYLMKLRNGDSDDRIASLMTIPRRTLERLMFNVREKLVQYFVPQNLGIDHITRASILEHNLLIPNGIYGNTGQINDNSIVICDGTYIYAHKSSNYRFQKESYSLHKYRNLLKPFMLVLCDGYILDCFGPYKATTSDAEIMTSLFNHENLPLRRYFRDNDIFILDRGFRDCIPLLEDCNYKVYMPESIMEGERQLTTPQANRSRCVTLCRWVVEVVNGYFKRDFKLFRQEFFHKSLPHMMQDFQIAAALLNRFAVRLRNRQDAPQILDRIRQRIHIHNNLADIVDNNYLNRRSSNFRNINADRNNLLYFPRLQYEDLILFALGTYQIRQAQSYYGEHIRFHGEYRIEVCMELPGALALDLLDLNVIVNEVSIIRGKIQSRHIGRKQYFVYILIKNNTSGVDGIIEYCCNCLVGRRTLGCCAHVMTIVWYLGWARYQDNINAPAAFLDEVFIREL